MPVSQRRGTRRQSTLVRNRSSMLNLREERPRAYERRRKINPRSSDRYHHEGEEEIRILGMPYERRRGKERERESDGRRPPIVN